MLSSKRVRSHIFKKKLIGEKLFYYLKVLFSLKHSVNVVIHFKHMYERMMGGGSSIQAPITLTNKALVVCSLWYDDTELMSMQVYQADSLIAATVWSLASALLVTSNAQHAVNT